MSSVESWSIRMLRGLRCSVSRGSSGRGEGERLGYARRWRICPDEFELHDCTPMSGAYPILARQRGHGCRTSLRFPCGILGQPGRGQRAPAQRCGRPASDVKRRCSQSGSLHLSQVHTQAAGAAGALSAPGRAQARHQRGDGRQCIGQPFVAAPVHGAEVDAGPRPAPRAPARPRARAHAGRRAAGRRPPRAGPGRSAGWGGSSRWRCQREAVQRAVVEQHRAVDGDHQRRRVGDRRSRAPARPRRRGAPAPARSAAARRGGACGPRACTIRAAPPARTATLRPWPRSHAGQLGGQLGLAGAFGAEQGDLHRRRVSMRCHPTTLQGDEHAYSPAVSHRPLYANRPTLTTLTTIHTGQFSTYLRPSRNWPDQADRGGEGVPPGHVGVGVGLEEQARWPARAGRRRPRVSASPRARQARDAQRRAVGAVRRAATATSPRTPPPRRRSAARHRRTACCARTGRSTSAS